MLVDDLTAAATDATRPTSDRGAAIASLAFLAANFPDKETAAAAFAALEAFGNDAPGSAPAPKQNAYRGPAGNGRRAYAAARSARGIPLLSGSEREEMDRAFGLENRPFGAVRASDGTLELHTVKPSDLRAALSGGRR